MRDCMMLSNGDTLARCACGALLRKEPGRREPAEYRKTCDGRWHEYGNWPEGEPPVCGQLRPHEPHDYADSSCVILHRTCRRCGRDNQEAAMPELRKKLR